jgi:hypothetical protein
MKQVGRAGLSYGLDGVAAGSRQVKIRHQPEVILRDLKIIAEPNARIPVCSLPSTAENEETL